LSHSGPCCVHQQWWCVSGALPPLVAMLKKSVPADPLEAIQVLASDKSSIDAVVMAGMMVLSAMHKAHTASVAQSICLSLLAA
jgi:hypothetical protein